MIYIRFRPNPDVPAQMIQIEEGKADPFDLGNRARDRIFPNEKLPERDPVAERILRQMKKNGICG